MGAFVALGATVLRVDARTASSPEPRIDTGANPDGIDAPGAQIQGGFNQEEAEDLAAALAAQ